MTEELAKYEEKSIQTAPQGLSPLVQAAMSGQLDTQKLSELLAIQKEYEANEARKAFHVALAEFKRYPLTIYKDKRVTFTSQKGTTDYNHATLGAALDEINPLLGKCGLSLTWDVHQEKNGYVKVTAILSHEMGHRETTSLFAAPDDSGNKNKIQQVGSTTEYLKRYTAFALLGISSRDMDDDGGKSEIKFISPEQAEILKKLVAEYNLNADGKWLGKFLDEYLHAESFDTLPAGMYGKARSAIDGIIKKMGSKGA